MQPRLTVPFIASACALLSSFTAPAHAQTPVVVDTSVSVSAKAWRATPSFGVETEYDDNIYLLSPSKRDDLDATGDTPTLSRRFAGMQSPGDLITSMEGRVGLKGPGLGGRTLEVRGDVRYELYARNAERAHLALDFAAEQSLRHGRHIRVSASVTPSYFSKNYLADAIDRSADGGISPDERIYEPGTYREMEGELDVRLRLKESTKRHPLGLALQPSVGFYSRVYEAPFSGRDMSGPTLGVKALMDLGGRVGINVAYQFASLRATPALQVMLLDESPFGRDFNGNGSTSDVSARAVEMADRSRTEHSVSATFRYEVSKRADLEIDAEHRSRTFGSSQPFDVANNGRTDSRNSFGAELGITITRAVRLVAGGEVRSQRINRVNDPDATGEIADYDKHRTRLGLSYRF